MQKINNTVGLILGAGKSERMNGFPKPLVKKDGKTFIENIYYNIKSSSISEIFLVTGYKTEVIENNVQHLNNLKIIYNKDFDNGQFSSLQTGLKYLNKNTSFKYILMTLCDIPFVKNDTYKQIISQIENNKIIIPSYNKKRGHPIIFDKLLVSKFLNADINSNAKSIINENSNLIKYVDVSDINILKDIDYYHDLPKLEI